MNKHKNNVTRNILDRFKWNHKVYHVINHWQIHNYLHVDNWEKILHHNEFITINYLHNFKVVDYSKKMIIANKLSFSQVGSSSQMIWHSPFLGPLTILRTLGSTLSFMFLIFLRKLKCNNNVKLIGNIKQIDNIKFNYDLK